MEKGEVLCSMIAQLTSPFSPLPSITPHVFLCRFYNCDQKGYKFVSILIDRLKYVIRKIIGVMQEAEPVKSFVCFFKSDTCFVYKIALLCACWHSAYKAPIAVPLRSTCFVRTYSRCFSVRQRYIFTILNANPYDFCAATFPSFPSPFSPLPFIKRVALI